MVPETSFTDKEQNALLKMNITSDMAHACEWIVRDDDNPDTLMTVFVAPTERPNELQAACSCRAGAKDEPCPHALDVLQRIRAQDHILQEILKKRPLTTAG